MNFLSALPRFDGIASLAGRMIDRSTQWTTYVLTGTSVGQRIEQAVLTSPTSRTLQGFERALLAHGLGERLDRAATERRFAEASGDPSLEVQRIIATLRGTRSGVGETGAQ